MADIVVRKFHALGRATALTKVRDMLETFRAEKPNLISKIEWLSDGYSARIEGTGFKGQAIVEETAVNVEISLSFFAKMMKGKVESGLQQRLDAALSA